MSAIPLDKIDSSDPNVEYRRSYRDDRIFRVFEDGSQEEVTPAQRYEEVVEFGGWLRTAGIAWYIMNQKVQRYAIRGEQLKRLGLTSEQHIRDAFGQPDHQSLSGSGMEYHYLSKALVIVWSRKKSSLDSIRVGNFRFGSDENDAQKGVLWISGIREVRLSKIKQWRTYAGLLEGMPTKRMNDGIIEHALVDAREYTSSNVQLISPPREKPEIQRDYPFGEPENLPPIICIGEFDSLNPAKDEDADGSSLTIVWFQDVFAMPISEDAQLAIEALDWGALANDTYY